MSVYSKILNNLDGIDIFCEFRTDSTDGTVTYIGQAVIGSADNEEKWAIRKVFGNTVADGGWCWANGNAFADKIWDKRKDGTYTYAK